MHKVLLADPALAGLAERFRERLPAGRRGRRGVELRRRGVRAGRGGRDRARERAASDRQGAAGRGPGRSGSSRRSASGSMRSTSRRRPRPASIVAYNPGVNRVGAAEHAVMLMLALVKRLPASERSTRAGRFSPSGRDPARHRRPRRRDGGDRRDGPDRADRRRAGGGVRVADRLPLAAARAGGGRAVRRAAAGSPGAPPRLDDPDPPRPAHARDPQPDRRGRAGGDARRLVSRQLRSRRAGGRGCLARRDRVRAPGGRRAWTSSSTRRTASTRSPTCRR